MLLNGDQVVEKIRAIPNEVRLLVVDQATDKDFADKGIIVSSKMSCIEHITCPAVKPFAGSCSRCFHPIQRSCDLRTWCK